MVIKIFFAFIDCIRCVANEQDCAWVRDRHAKLCLACGKAKQKCIGAVWEQGEGTSGEPSGSAVGELGGMAAMMREMVEGQRDLVEEIQNLGELVEGIFWGRNPVADSEDYEEWLEQEWSEEVMEKESKELESEKAEYRDFVKGLREKQAEEEEKQVEESVVVENEGKKKSRIDIGMPIGSPIVVVLFLLSFSFC